MASTWLHIRVIWALIKIIFFLRERMLASRDSDFIHLGWGLGIVFKEDSR